MKYIVKKNGSSVNFIDENGKKFNYVDFANNLYLGDKIIIKKYEGLTEEEKKIIEKTVKELNDLSNPKKRKKIISQFDL